MLERSHAVGEEKTLRRKMPHEKNARSSNRPKVKDDDQNQSKDNRRIKAPLAHLPLTVPKTVLYTLKHRFQRRNSKTCRKVVDQKGCETIVKDQQKTNTRMKRRHATSLLLPTNAPELQIPLYKRAFNEYQPLHIPTDSDLHIDKPLRRGGIGLMRNHLWSRRYPKKCTRFI